MLRLDDQGLVSFHQPFIEGFAQGLDTDEGSFWGQAACPGLATAWKTALTAVLQLAAWLSGCLAAWLPGCLAAWLPGRVNSTLCI
jgi:hypothetical protein